MSGDVWQRDAESRYRLDPRRAKLEKTSSLAPTINFPVTVKESDNV